MSHQIINHPLLPKKITVAGPDLVLMEEWRDLPIEVRCVLMGFSLEDINILKAKLEAIRYDGFLELISKRYRDLAFGLPARLPELVPELIQSIGFEMSWQTIRRRAKNRTLPIEIINEATYMIEKELYEIDSDDE